METKSQNTLMETGIVGLSIPYYLNIYRDDKGAEFYSPQLSDDGECPRSFDCALAEAYKHSVCGKLEYVTTLSNTTQNVTAQMLKRIYELDDLADELRGLGGDPSACTHDDIGAVIADIKQDERYGSYQAQVDRYWNSTRL